MTRLDLRRVGGACAVLYIFVLIVALVLLAVTGLLDAEDAAEVLPTLAEDQALAATANWLFVLAPLLLAVAGVGFFHAMRSAGSLMWVAVLTFVGGGLLALFRGLIWLAMTYELAPAYVSAAEDARTTLANVGDTLISLGYMSGDIVGGVLVAGVAVPLFSVAILHTKAAPGWVAWLGFVVSILAGWLTPLIPVADVFEVLGFLGVVGFFVWMAAVGVVVWRTPAPAESQVGAPMYARVVRSR